MKLETKLNKILAMPDSPLKLLKLENWCMQLMPHGSLFESAMKEHDRLFRKYRTEKGA